MKKVVIIGANDFQNRLIIRAKELGYQTHVFAWADGAVGAENGDFFYNISIKEKEKILDTCRAIRPDAVVSIASDLAVETVCYVANALGLIANSQESVYICTNKFDMRQRLQECGVPVPRFMKCGSSVNEKLLEKLSFPVIVKPTDRSGSRGICKVEKFDDLSKAIQHAVEQSFSGEAIIEEFIAGNEYSCECITQNGRHCLLAITEKFTTGEPHYIETGHIQPHNIPYEYYDKIQKLIFTALDSLKITQGASHSEFRITREGQIGIVEIGARMGGDYIGSDLVVGSTGLDYLKMVLDVALGNPIDAIPNQKATNIAVKFIFCQNDLMLLERIEHDTRYCIQRKSHMTLIDDVNTKVVDSGSRHGYYIVTSESRELLTDIFNVSS